MRFAATATDRTQRSRRASVPRSVLIPLLLPVIISGCVTINRAMPPKPMTPTLPISADGCMAPEGWQRLLEYVTDLEAGYD